MYSGRGLEGTHAFNFPLSLGRLACAKGRGLQVLDVVTSDCQAQPRVRLVQPS